MSIDYSPAAACRGCKKSVDAKSAYFCPTCGDCICADCAKKNNGVCRRCFSARWKDSVDSPGSSSPTCFFQFVRSCFCARKESQKGISKAVASDRSIRHTAIGNVFFIRHILNSRVFKRALPRSFWSQSRREFERLSKRH